ncbi:MAG: hypothetical protein HYW48_03015 [Deltaproteobacteria bacterium]|nr:hypothetical protein [Deltaproteobacteria bacterium]
MSQISSVKDQFDSIRQRSAAQENQILREIRIESWQKSDATKVLMAERVIGILALPVLFLWALILMALSIGVALSLAVFQLFNKLLR